MVRRWKKTTVTKITSLSVLFGVCVATGIAASVAANKCFQKADAYSVSSLPTIINLNSNTEEEIRNYYSALDSLPESERQGTNLLKNLKSILKNGQKYYSYESGDKIWKMYEITDRDWDKSPASAISGYDASTNIITGYSYGSSATNKGMNPYLHALYVNRSIDNKMHAWARESDDTTSHGNNKEWGIDREHIWPKSHGFEDEAQGGARGDPMHLWPGDSDVNSSLHSNEFYGFVNITSSTKAGKWEYAENSKVSKISEMRKEEVTNNPNINDINNNSGFSSQNPPSSKASKPSCRICFLSYSNEENPLISPCKCNGSMKNIHYSSTICSRVPKISPPPLSSCRMKMLR